MPLDINTGYSNAFKTFVDFAEQAQKHGHDAATAKASLSSRTITVASVHLYGGVGVFTSSGEKAANNATRASFKAAIIDMFGGEDKIPADVKEAMKLDDCGLYASEHAALDYSLSKDDETGAVVDKLFSVVKDPMKRKVITTLLNQNLVADLFSLMDRRPVQSYAGGAAGDQLEFLYTTEGSDQFVSKGFMEDEDTTNTIVTGNWDLVVALDVSEDGKTATLSFSQVKVITQNGSNDEDRLIGQVELIQKSTLDLTKGIPEVTDVTFSQEFSADKVAFDSPEIVFNA
jgi:hypothetical protein